MATTTINGQLEIDHERGVIYFHCSSDEQAEKYKTVTILRICSLPRPIPKNEHLDVTHMHSTNWEGK